MNKFTLRLTDGRWVSSPTNIVTDNPNLAGVFTATDDQSAAELRGAIERLHGPLEIVRGRSSAANAFMSPISFRRFFASCAGVSISQAIMWKWRSRPVISVLSLLPSNGSASRRRHRLNYYTWNSEPGSDSRAPKGRG